MSSFLGDFVCGSRNVLAQGFRSLPVLVTSFLLVLGLIQANLNFLFFFVGMILVATIGAALVNMAWELIFSNTPTWLTIPRELWQVAGGNAAACNLFSFVPENPPTAITVVPTYWSTMMIFFFTYLFLNALRIYNHQANSRGSKEQVSYRKYQAGIAMAMIVAVGVTVTAFRQATSCETGLGLLIGGLVGGSLAQGWHDFMRQCGLGTLDDMFGIMNRILPMQSQEDNEPTVCVPAGE